VTASASYGLVSLDVDPAGAADRIFPYRGRAP